jgi:Na+/proline symporter/signal transduction histidine kinase/ActR/RegA family two-component response regulator
MIDGWIIVALSFLYIGVLFCIAYWGDRAGRRQTSLSGRPYVYALTLGVYCTSWTFFGSVGSAAQKGLDFIAVYLGPIIAFTLAAPLLRRIILLTKTQNITSIADFIAARYGKNPAVAAIVTVVAVAGLLPYIALQLKAISQSVALLFGFTSQDPGVSKLLPIDMALFIALVLAAFTMLFGARQTDATEHQRGLMLAIAAESVVKLAAFLVVGIGVVFFMFGGFGPLMAEAASKPVIAKLFENGIHGGTLLTVTWLSFVCIFLLPRQFHVTFVENVSEDELRKAFWLFPLYLIAINIFVVPVAIAGILRFSGTDVPPDMYLLALPYYSGNHILTFLAFLGGLSAATAMVVVETVALSIMVCNDLLLPVILQRRTAGAEGSKDMSRLLLNIRRASILAIILLAYSFYDNIEKTSLAEIGLLSFAAIAQFAPAFFIGFLWRRATARGALAGILAGFAVWAYTLLLPKLIAGFPDGAAFLKDGPFGLAILRPEMLFYLHFDHLTHGVVWSLFANVLALITVSLLRPPEPIERLQTNVFIEEPPAMPGVPAFRPWRTRIPMNELITTAARYLGQDRAERSFAEYMAMRGMDPKDHAHGDMHVLKFTENLLASAIGAPSSRLVMSMMLRRLNVGRESALKLLDEASEAVQYNRDLFQTALEHVGQGLAVFDKKMQLICWNRQFREILMLPPQFGRIGVPLEEIVRYMAQREHESPSAVANLVADRIEKYQVSMETFHVRSIEGRIVEVRTNAMPLGGIVVTYTDITEREAAAAALARANEHLERRVQARTQELAIAKAKADEANISKTRFLAAASHDVLQPLNAARLYAASLLERSPPAELGRLARNIDASLDGVEEILTALLDISKLDSGAMKPEYAVFPINELLDQLRIDFEPIAKSRGIQLSIVQSHSLVRSDRKLLRRILQNLISNALKYNREKGCVLVGCRHRGKSLHVEVHDTGPGIPEHQRELVFKEFQRLDGNSRGVPGLGLGLSIVDRMCKVLNHKLDLRSVPGRGSVFLVGLPLARWLDQEQPRPFNMRPLPYGNLRGAIVLCLDNDRSIIDGMSTLLANWHCPVITALDSEQAIAKLEAAKIVPDIIISDYHLDRENGLEAIQDICTACCEPIPAIIVTADGAQEVRQSVLLAGHAFLPKPLKPAALRALISQMIVQRRAAE